MSEVPRIIVDEDFKAQVEREKEEARRKAATVREGEGAETPMELPPANMESLIGILGTQAMAYLGFSPNSQDGSNVDLTLARFHIDLLELLQEKTRMNLTGVESDALKNWLYQLRMLYVETSKREASKPKGTDLDSSKHQRDPHRIHTP